MSSVCYVRIDFADANNFERRLSAESTIFRKQSTFYQHYFYTASAPLSYVCGIDCSPPMFKINRRVTDESFLIFVYGGKGTLNGIPFSANQFFIIPPNYPTTLISDAEDPWKLCWIAWRGNMSEYFTKTIRCFDPEKIYSFPNSYGIQRIFSGLLYTDHSHADIMETLSHFAEYVISIVAKDISPIDTFTEPDTQNRRKINYVEKAKAIMAEQYATINIASLSKMLYLNSKYFCQIFHEITGITPQQYLIDIRLRNSVIYLENSNLTLKSIAEACGYSSYTGYVDAFKQKYGESPKKYRKRMNSEGGIL